jgi:hypothetical protein
MNRKKGLLKMRDPDAGSEVTLCRRRTLSIVEDCAIKDLIDLRFQFQFICTETFSIFYAIKRDAIGPFARFLKKSPQAGNRGDHDDRQQARNFSLHQISIQAAGKRGKQRRPFGRWAKSTPASANPSPVSETFKPGPEPEVILGFGPREAPRCREPSWLGDPPQKVYRLR